MKNYKTEYDYLLPHEKGEVSSTEIVSGNCDVKEKSKREAVLCGMACAFHRKHSYMPNEKGEVCSTETQSGNCDVKEKSKRQAVLCVLPSAFHRKHSLHHKILEQQEGWTFLETLIVIAIIAVLTATVGFTAINALDNARRTSASTQIDSFSVALEAYYIDCGFYPTTEQGLSALYRKPTSEPVSDYWNGPYILKNIPNDPWGHPYDYFVPGPEGFAYGVRSFGADGGEGGEGKNADIVSWSQD